MSNMSMSAHSAPSWLFSFVDLAFLLLLAVTQIGSDERAHAIDFGEVAVPRIPGGATTQLERDAGRRWQLRVHPPEDGVAPFELIVSGDESADRLPLEALRSELASLHRAGVEQPLLAPHSDSRSQDMLEAVALLEAQWGKGPGEGRLATVVPEYAQR